MAGRGGCGSPGGETKNVLICLQIFCLFRILPEIGFNLLSSSSSASRPSDDNFRRALQLR